MYVWNTMQISVNPDINFFTKSTECQFILIVTLKFLYFKRELQLNPKIGALLLFIFNTYK